MNLCEQVLSQLAARRDAPARFRWPFPEDRTRELLACGYESEVVSRGMTYRPDGITAERFRQAARWLTQSRRPCLLLYGGVGNGKTTLARAIRQVIGQVRRTADRCLGTQLWRMSDTERRAAERIQRVFEMPEWYSATDIVGSLYTPERFARIKHARFLVIDDMGCEPATAKTYGTETAPIAELIYARYDRMLPTIITSNLDDDGIRLRYGEPIADRFDEVFDKIAYDNPSYRSNPK